MIDSRTLSRIASPVTPSIIHDDSLRIWFELIWDYTLRVFPNPDPVVGEWIQIRDRRGEPVERVVALPVKDPYHVARNFVQLLEIFSTTDQKTH